MRKIFLLIAILLNLSAQAQLLGQFMSGGRSGIVHVSTLAPTVSVWGQSNAAGMELSPSGLPVDYQGDQAYIKIANYGYQTDALTYVDQPFSFLPLNPFRQAWNVYTLAPSFTPGLWGVEQSLTHLLQEHYNTTIYLDKLAFGGMAIAQWQSGGFWYNFLQTVADDEEAYYAANGLTVKWLPVIWIQGESDAASGMNTATYQAHLEGVIDNERSKSSATRPWIFQKLTYDQTALTHPQIDAINAAFDNIANGSRPYCYVFDPATITITMLDNIHYDGPTNLLIGEAYFNLMVNEGLVKVKTKTIDIRYFCKTPFDEICYGRFLKRA